MRPVITKEVTKFIKYGAGMFFEPDSSIILSAKNNEGMLNILHNRLDRQCLYVKFKNLVINKKKRMQRFIK